MKRRDFITLLCSAAARPLAARAQQTPVIGYLAARSLETDLHLVAAFRQSLVEVGFVENQNLRIQYRFADGQYDLLPGMAADLIAQRVAVIVASTSQAAQAAKDLTTTIPIVFSSGADPVTIGLVTTLSHPSGNLTGLTTFNGELGSKQFGLMDEVVPAPAVIAYLCEVNNSRDLQNVQSAARALNRELVILNVSGEGDIDAAFMKLREQRVGGLFVSASALLATRLHQIVALANHYRIPTVYPRREYAVAGGLMSYGTSFIDAYHQLGTYVGRILKGTKPSDLPVLLPTKFEFVINLKTAKSTGFDVPPALSARADEIIE